MSLVPFLKWYPNDKCVLRGHGIEEDVRYICGDWPARYPVPATMELTNKYWGLRVKMWYLLHFGRPHGYRKTT